VLLWLQGQNGAHGCLWRSRAGHVHECTAFLRLQDSAQFSTAGHVCEERVMLGAALLLTQFGAGPVSVERDN